MEGYVSDKKTKKISKEKLVRVISREFLGFDREDDAEDELF